MEENELTLRGQLLLPFSFFFVPIRFPPGNGWTASSCAAPAVGFQIASEMKRLDRSCVSAMCGLSVHVSG